MDFILAYPQAPVETPLFMRIPKGFTMADKNMSWSWSETYMAKNKQVECGTSI